MQLPSHTDYPLLILICLSRKPSQFFTSLRFLSMIAHKNHLVKIVRSLAKIRSVINIKREICRTKLAKTPNEGTIGDIVRQIKAASVLIYAFNILIKINNHLNEQET